MSLPATDPSECVTSDWEESDIKRSHDDDIQHLVACYQRVDRERMQDLEHRNDALWVEAVGFCNRDSEKLVVLISPWFLNLVLVPGEQTDWSAHKHGDIVQHTLPTGCFDFIHGDLEGFGEIQSCSLMSPVGDLQDQQTARLIGQEVMRQMLADPEPETPKTQATISRRELLRGWQKYR